jgi:cytochrome P450
VREEPALIPHLVKESLRWVSPIKHFMRRAAKDYVLRDRQIREVTG